MGLVKSAAFTFTGLMLTASMANAATNYAGTNTIVCASGTGTVGYTLDQLAYAIETGKLSTRDRDGMLIKVASANSKTLARKWSDAIANVDSIIVKVDDLYTAAKPKTDSATANAITSAGRAAVECIPAQ